MALSWGDLYNATPLLASIYLPDGEESGCLFEPTVDRGCYSLRYRSLPGGNTEFIVQLSRYNSPLYAEGAADGVHLLLHHQYDVVPIPDSADLPPHSWVFEYGEWLLMAYPQAEILVMVWHHPIDELSFDANLGVLIAIAGAQSQVLHAYGYLLSTPIPTPTSTPRPPAV